ncbi:MAG: NAD(P)-dependent dehydrogenase (short-subunit alcohol dehydrogenase family), partial [Porticoccaceae bacterium]
VSEIEENGGKATFLTADLTDRDSLSDIAKQASEAFGAVDILINAAGVNLRQPADEITLESWDETINLNLSVPFFLAQELVPSMQAKSWGRIINIASLQSSRAFANGIAYGASKGGIAQLTRAMAEAWSSTGINCNAIAPGFFPTGLTAPVYENPEMLDKLAAQTAIGRNGELQDLDGVTTFLAAAASDYITGQVIHLDGGFTAK